MQLRHDEICDGVGLFNSVTILSEYLAHLMGDVPLSPTSYIYTFSADPFFGFATFHNRTRDFQPMIYLLQTVIDKICFVIEILCFEIILFADDRT